MRHILFSMIELIIMGAIFAVCDESGVIKYVVVMVYALGFMILGRKKRWMADVPICILIPIAAYLSVGCIVTLFHASIYSETMKIILFWIIPFLFAFSLYIFYGKEIARIIDIQFIASALVYVITKARFIIESHSSESMFAYAYGAFFVYYVYKKRWGMCVLALPLMWLAEKRIVVAAAFVAIFIQGILWLFRNDRRMANFIWAVAAIISNLYLWLIYSGTLKAFCEGVGINTNGRARVFAQTAEWFGGNYISFGNGLGSVEAILSAWKLEKFLNLHNDLLKFHIELGLLGFLLYFGSFAVVFYLIEKKYGKKKMTFFVSMASYLVVLFSTDNVSIYVIFLLPFYSIYFAVLSANDEEDVLIRYDEKSLEQIQK